MFKKINSLTLVLILSSFLSAASDAKPRYSFTISRLNNESDFVVTFNDQAVLPGQKSALTCTIPFITAARYREQIVRNLRYVPKKALKLIIGKFCWRLWHDERGVQKVLETPSEDVASEVLIPSTLLRALGLLNKKAYALTISDEGNFSLQ